MGEIIDKPIYECTPEEYIAVNTVNGFVQYQNALKAVEIARLENEPFETRKAMLIHGITKKDIERGRH